MSVNLEEREMLILWCLLDDIGNWLDIFANGVTKHLSKEQFEVFKEECRAILKERIYSEEEGWLLDYRRLRVRAVKI